MTLNRDYCQSLISRCLFKSHPFAVLLKGPCSYRCTCFSAAGRVAFQLQSLEIQVSHSSSGTCSLEQSKERDSGL